jgi:hypothetical protein
MLRPVGLEGELRRLTVIGPACADELGSARRLAGSPLFAPKPRKCAIGTCQQLCRMPARRQEDDTIPEQSGDPPSSRPKKNPARDWRGFPFVRSDPGVTGRWPA